MADKKNKENNVIDKIPKLNLIKKGVSEHEIIHHNAAEWNEIKNI